MIKNFFPFQPELVSGRIINRYKRFLADIILADGQQVLAHVPNSGRMSTCWVPGAPVVLTRHSPGTERKLLYTLQAVEMPDGWVGVNTLNPNRAVFNALLAGAIEELLGYKFVQSEVQSSTGSRFDLCLFDAVSSDSLTHLALNEKKAMALPGTDIAASMVRQPAVIEIKNATLRCREGVTFPDAVTARGLKHTRHLIQLRKLGFRAILLFFAGRSNTAWVGPADHIDPDYGRALRLAIKCGVEVLALQVAVSANGLAIIGMLPFVCD